MLRQSQSARRHDVDVDTKHVTQFVLKTNEIEQRGSLLEGDQQVDVARSRIFPSRHGTEDPNVAPAISLDQSADIHPPLGDNV
jgi:hypothetical protein